VCKSTLSIPWFCTLVSLKLAYIRQVAIGNSSGSSISRDIGWSSVTVVLLAWGSHKILLAYSLDI
jgi:hypothetical protein